MPPAPQDDKDEADRERVGESVNSPGEPRAYRRGVLRRYTDHLKRRLGNLRSDGKQGGRVEDLQRSLDELRASVQGLTDTLTNIRQTTDGHAAWLSDLQKWMSSCVQVLNTLADVPPIPSARVQASAPPARRRDDVEEIKRQFQIWTIMTWLDQAVVPSDRLVSVIMPTRNRCGWIGRAIASIQAQTYENWELVVVDDGSSDDTALLLSEAAVLDERIRYLHIEHAGAAVARNVGLAHATGDIICYLDDDNVMHPGWLRAVAWAFSCWPETDVLYGARIIEDDMAQDGTRSGNLPSIRFRAWDRGRLESSNYIDQNVIAHRTGLPEAHFDEALPMEDWDLMLRMTARRRPLELPVLACLYSTTAPHRESEKPQPMDVLHGMRARAHMGRPLRLWVLRRRPEDSPDGPRDTDLTSIAEEGGYVGVTEVSLPASDPDVETETSGFVTAIEDHNPDVVLVCGADMVAGLSRRLEAGGRPFAVLVTDRDAGVAGLLHHPLLLGQWHVPQPRRNGWGAIFLDELAERLRIWKLDISED